MGRRKKKIDINGNATSSLTYNGFVTIEKMRGNKTVSKTTIHNTGCLPLFRFFAECLTLYTDTNGNLTGLFNSKPQYLNAFYQATSEQETQLQLSGHERIKSYIKQSNMSSSYSVSTTSLSDQKNAWYQVDLKFLLQDNNFLYLDPRTQSNNINILALYSGNNVSSLDNPHAYITIPEVRNYLKYEAGVNYLITWSIRISN